MPEDSQQKQAEHDRRGNYVATRVWQWLHQQKAIQFVPWVINPSSEKYDPLKAAQQHTRDELLLQLESVMVEASKDHDRMTND